MPRKETIVTTRKPSTAGLLFGLAHGVKKYFALAILAAMLSILFNFLMPQVVRVTVDSVIGSDPFALPAPVLAWLERLGGRAFLRDNLLMCGACVVLFSILAGLCNFLSRNSVSHASETFIKTLRDRLFSHTQRLPFSWHVQNQTGDIIQRCSSDVDVVRNFVAQQMIEVIRTVVLVIIAMVLMFSMNVTLSLITLAFIPVIMTYTMIFYSKIGKRFLIADQAEGDLTISAQENLTGVRVVRAFGREAYEVDRFLQKSEYYSGLWIKLGAVLGAYWGIGDIVTGGLVLVVIAAGAVIAARGDITLGEFLVFVTYCQMLAWPVRGLGRILSEMSKTGVSVKRLREILDAPAEQEEPDALTPPLDGDIVFDNVSFVYDAQPVLKNLSFTVARGTTFGIMGGTGAGKSTITYLLNRLHELPPDSGTITIGGVDIRRIDRAHLRRHIGLVLQEPFLFSKTILENISIASPLARMEDVRHSASIAAIDDAITSFSKGYDTVVGERGVTLSGGQKQRVAIARTLMMGSPILVFDDSLSAVDLETDARIRDALRTHTGGATVILISHRINTLMHADKILVLEDGAAAQIGTHEQLIRTEGAYKRIYEAQSRSGDDVLLAWGGEEDEARMTAFRPEDED